MRPDALQLLDGGRQFLLEDLQPHVPASMRSDLRALAKTLMNARTELDQLFPLLAMEIDELTVVVGTACEVLERPGPQGAATPALSITEISVRHTALLDLAGDLAIEMQGRREPRVAATLADIYALLGRQGRRRMTWQSVFPADRPVSDTLLTTTRHEGE